MRIIDADKIIKFIRDEYHGGYSEVQLAPYEVINMIDEQPTVNQWIPASERLPLERVDMFSDELNPFIMQLDGYYPTVGYIDTKNQWYFDPHGKEPAYNVIAWQPMPARYKGATNEQ